MQSVRTIAAAAGLFCCAIGAQSKSRPNIVLILADDLGYGDPRCYNAKSKIPTPHIDRLARQGRRFTDAHSPSSVCSPTRYGILTGRYAWRTRLRRGVLWAWARPLIEKARTTLPEMLRTRGYATACIGKWHLGWDWPAGRTRIDWSRPIAGGPLAHGFDSYFGDDVPNFPPYAFIENDRVTARPTTTKPKAMFGRPGPAAPGWDLAAVLPAIAQRAGSWIDERARKTETPFFLYLPLTGPHTPIAPSPHFAGKSKAGHYGDWVCEVDWAVGVVLAALDRNELTDDTLVIFTSDNGSPQRDGSRMAGAVGSVRKRFGHDPSAPWRGLKSDIWEGGHRVPCIARWPGHVPDGTTCAEPVVLTDLYRTIAGIVGHSIGEHEAEDSFDQRDALLGLQHDAAARDHVVHHSGKGIFAIRTGNWKLILGRGSGGFTRFNPDRDAPPGQLYDLAQDPGETNNRYADEPAVVARLRARLDHIRSTGRSAPRD